MGQTGEKSDRSNPLFDYGNCDDLCFAEDAWVDFESRGNRLLIVDTRLERQVELTSRFRRFGYSVAVASGAEEAIRILDTEPGFDFAILDPESMGKSGLRLAKHCASCSDLNQIKIVPLYESRDTIADDVFVAIGAYENQSE